MSFVLLRLVQEQQHATVQPLALLLLLQLFLRIFHRRFVTTLLFLKSFLTLFGSISHFLVLLLFQLEGNGGGRLS